MFNIQFGQITKFKIIYNNIPHTPSKMGVMVRNTFSLTLDEAMSVGLAKACALRKKNLFCYREIYYLTEYSSRMRNLHVINQQEYGREGIFLV